MPANGIYLCAVFRMKFILTGFGSFLTVNLSKQNFFNIKYIKHKKLPAARFELTTSNLGGWRSIHAELRGHIYTLKS